MGKDIVLTLGLLMGCLLIASAQTSKLPAIDSLKQAVIDLEQEVYKVKLNLHNSQKQLKTGILVATVGYSITIIGGQLLGSEPDLGKTLLYVGGSTGIAGTFILVRGFRKISLGPPSAPRNYSGL